MNFGTHKIGRWCKKELVFFLMLWPVISTGLSLVLVHHVVLIGKGARRHLQGVLNVRLELGVWSAPRVRGDRYTVDGVHGRSRIGDERGLGEGGPGSGDSWGDGGDRLEGQGGDFLVVGCFFLMVFIGGVRVS